MLSHSSVVLLFSAFSEGLFCIFKTGRGQSVTVGTLALHRGIHKSLLVGLSKSFCALIGLDLKQISWKQSVGSPWFSTQSDPSISKTNQISSLFLY